MPVKADIVNRYEFEEFRTSSIQFYANGSRNQHLDALGFEPETVLMVHCYRSDDPNMYMSFRKPTVRLTGKSSFVWMEEKNHFLVFFQYNEDSLIYALTVND